MPSAINPALHNMAENNDKKRPHAEGDETPRKHKKSKSIMKSDEFVKHEGSSDDAKPEPAQERSRKAKKDKADKKEKKDRKEKKDKDRKDREKKDKGRTDKEKKDKTHKNARSPPPPDDPVFPFYTQTVSLWLPIYPVGFDRPVTSAANQHLAGLLHHYSPLLGGYLLAYRNVNLADTAVRADPRHPPTDETPATLASVDEYAVGFGWLTADVDLFIPSRGAWLEGRVILQNEGAIGVNCWDKFNASIEAARLPHGWQWVDIGERETPGGAEAPAEAMAEDTDANQDANTDAAPAGDGADGGNDDLAPLQATGYWADENGQPVEGTLRFRVKDFDVGLAGDNGYLAIEGTMLGEGDERALRQRERERLRKGLRNQGSRVAANKTRRLNEFSITQFGREDEEEESGRRVELYKGSRPGTPDD